MQTKNKQTDTTNEPRKKKWITNKNTRSRTTVPRRYYYLILFIYWLFSIFAKCLFNVLAKYFVERFQFLPGHILISFTIPFGRANQKREKIFFYCSVNNIKFSIPF